MTCAAIFRVTKPTGEYEDFQSLGSQFRNVVCIENCFDALFGEGNVIYHASDFFRSYGKYLAFRPYTNKRTVVVPSDTGGIDEWTIEKIPVTDPRYETTTPVRNFEHLFGQKPVQHIIKTTKESSITQLAGNFVPVYDKSGAIIAIQEVDNN